MTTLIQGGTIVNEGRAFKGSLLIDEGRISDITEGTQAPRAHYDQRVDATGSFILPGIIDEHVHFREPGLTQKADIESETRAAARGGVTSFLDMPNTVPQTTTIEALQDKWQRAAKESHVNYGFFFGATNTNSDVFDQIDPTTIPGIKLFMGASTGNMLVEKLGALIDVFKSCARLHLPLMTHCEDSDIISRNLKQMKQTYGDDPDVTLHPLIRSEEACFDSSALAVNLAREFGTRLHIAHLSTAKELSLVSPWTDTPNPQADAADKPLPQITGEAVIAHLWFTADDYLTKRALIKCNPAVKTTNDRNALRRALSNGLITAIGTDHAPHLLSEKQGGCVGAASGMPMIQFSLVSMLELVELGVLSIERLVWLMCHNPARLFSINRRGFLRKGYQADIVIVKHGEPWTVTENCIESKCGWSPMTGQKYHYQVTHTFCNGHLIYNNGTVDSDYRGEPLHFRIKGA
ncbi:MAG: dihydroorotase [Prevotella sp.]|jgi:dihydroorotase